MQFTTNAKPSSFAYPEAIKPPSDEKIEKVATAVLSTTAKAKARQKKKEADKKEEGMTVDSPTTPTAAAKKDADETKKADADAMDTDKKDAATDVRSHSDHYEKKGVLNSFCKKKKRKRKRSRRNRRFSTRTT